MKLVIVTCVHGREEIFKVWANNVYDMMSGVSTHRAPFDLEVVAVGNEKPIYYICRANGIKYIKHKNKPLGTKWQAGLAAAREMDPDAVMIVGSDDIFSVRLIKEYYKALEEDSTIDVLGLKDAYIMDLTDGATIHWEGYPEDSKRFMEPIGSAKVLTRGILEKAEWDLWPPAANKNLDGSLMLRIQLADNRFRMVVLEMHDIQACLLALKGGDDINPFELYVGPTEEALQLLRNHFDLDIVKKILDLTYKKTGNPHERKPKL